jgi:sulfoacetaldehyde acetyltransferase
MTASEAFVETLASHKVTDTFGIVGSAFMDPLHSFGTAGIRFISVQHEQNAAHMADGYARVSGKHGVCIGQNGPGVTNFMNGIATAFWAHSPVVAITPQTATTAVGLGGFQEVDQLPLFGPITKYQGHVHHPSRIADITDYAFYRALVDRGPTQINIPRDFFSYVEDFTLPVRKTIHSPQTSSDVIAKIINKLNNSCSPVILAGGGVVSSNSKIILEEFADKKNIPVATTYLHNDAFNCENNLYLGPIGYNGSQRAMDALENSDFILALGTRLGPFGTLPQYGKDYWPKNAFVVQVDVNPQVLGLSKKSDMIVHSDAHNFILELLAKTSCEPLTSTPATANAQHYINYDNSTYTDCAHPRNILKALSECIPSNAMVSTDVGNVCALANHYLHFGNEGNFLAPLSYGSCGSALPTIMGAKVAAPDRPALAFVGDGAWGMSMNETLTCIREKIPVTVVVFNNRQWGAEKKNQVLWFNNRYVGTNLKNPSFANVAKSMGADGIRITSENEVKEAMEEALHNQTQGVTTVIEVMLSRWLGEPFRRDAMKPPRRYLPKYLDDNVENESENDQPMDMIP